MHPRTARGNRIGLALVGLVLLVGGATALLRGLGIAPAIFGPAHDPLLPSPLRRFAAEQGWWLWPVLAAAALLLAALGLRWLLAQARSDALRRISLEPDPGQGATDLEAHAVIDAVEDEITGYPGVRRVRASLTGHAAQPRVHLSVTLAERADLAAIRDRIEGEALAHLRAALETQTLAAELRLHPGTG